MVAVDEGEVEAAALREEPRQRGLRLLGVVLDDVADAGLVEQLEPAVREARRLVGVDRDVRPAAVLEQAVAR